jgi:hypothetical protein
LYCKVLARSVAISVQETAAGGRRITWYEVSPPAFVQVRETSVPVTDAESTGATSVGGEELAPGRFRAKNAEKISANRIGFLLTRPR